MYFGDEYYGLRPRRYSSNRGAHLLLRRRQLRLPPSSTQFDSRGSPSTLATTTTPFALADTTRLEGLALHFGDDRYSLRPRRHRSARGARLRLRRQLLRPSPSPTHLGSRGSPFTSAMTTAAFSLANTPRLEGLTLHFGDDCCGLRPHRHISARGARPPLRRPLTVINDQF